MKGQLSLNHYSGHFYVVNFPLELRHSQQDNVHSLIREPAEVMTGWDNNKVLFILERYFPICSSDKDTLEHLWVPI